MHPEPPEASSAQVKETTRPPRCQKSWLLPGRSADSNSGGFSSPFPRCLQNSDWLPSYEHILRVRFPNSGVSEDCLYLNIYAPAHADTGAKLPVRLRARWAGARLAGPWAGPRADWLGVWNQAQPPAG